VKVETPSQTEIVIKGLDKQQVGQVAAEVRAYRSPEPYKARACATPTSGWSEGNEEEVGNRDDRQESGKAPACFADAPKIHELAKVRLAVHRTNTHIYAQLRAVDGKVLTSASTMEKEVRTEVPNGGNKAAAVAVGKRIAEKAKGLGIQAVAFDRSGYKYHGRVKALADAAREAGLKF